MIRILLLLLALTLSTHSRFSAAADAADVKSSAFDILEYVIEGNTVLPVQDIERAVYPHLGEKKTIANVEAARESLSSRLASMAVS